MPALETLLIFTAAALLMNLSPGPSNFYVMSRSISQGWRAGFTAAAGLALGSLVHVALTVAGLSALIAYSPTGYMILKYLGAAYLTYLGVRTLMAAGTATPLAGEPAPPKPSRRILIESTVVEVLNPKTALFFVAFLPQFVDPAIGPAAVQLAVFGLIVTVSALPCDAAVALAGHAAADWMKRNPIVGRIQDRVSGSILIGLGIWAAWPEGRRG